MTTPATRPATRWVIHVILMALYLFAGVGKLVMTAEQMAGPVSFPLWFMRFIGVCEAIGGLGLVVPIATRIAPWLTRLAAWGLVVIMVGAVATSLMGTPKSLAALPFVVLCLVAWVAATEGRYAGAARPDTGSTRA